MAKTPALKGFLAGCLLLLGVAPLSADPTVAQMLTFTPRQKDVNISSPTKDEQDACKVQLVKGTRTGSSGWELLDAKKQPLRRFFDSDGDKQIDIWSYFKDGVEVYREIDTNKNGKADQYRWLNANGMKWGVDVNEDGRIEAWRLISAEEAGQEAFLSLAAHDFERLKALFISENEMAAIKLPANQVQRLTALQKQASVKFETVTGKLPQLTGAAFVRVEAAPPSCVLGEQFGGDNDLIKYSSRAILYETEAGEKKEKKHEWLQTGEMIQVGLAWRLVDVPTPDDGGPADVRPPDRKVDEELAKLLDKLSELDKSPQKAGYYGERIDLLQKIVARDEAKNREGWYKQLFDNLAASAQGGEKAHLSLLIEMRKEVERQAGGTPTGLVAYATYREMWTQYAIATNDPKKSPAEITKIQDAWLEQLAKFVQTYPNAEDSTPEALIQLAINAEFSSTKDEEAKRWYRQLYTNFPKHVLAEKAHGCEERLSLVGNTFQLTAEQLAGGAFNVATLKGKSFVVYYWSSNCSQCVGDFARLKKVYEKSAGKGDFELVCVNLDETAADAGRYLKATPVPGIHLVSATAKGPGGLSSPLALQFGINSLPTMFLIGPDGKVVNNKLQIAELEAEAKK